MLAVSLLSTTAIFAADGSGVRAAVDAKGNLRPLTAAEEKALATPQRSFMRITPKVHANGMVSIELDESFDHAFVVRIDEEGNLDYTCTDDKEEAAKFAASAASIDSIMRIKPITTRGPRVAERE
jgi:hypothetical protein